MVRLRRVQQCSGEAARERRRGAATLDYVLLLGVLFTMSTVIVMSGRRIMQLVYEMTAFFLAWPFM